MIRPSCTPLLIALCLLFAMLVPLSQASAAAYLFDPGNNAAVPPVVGYTTVNSSPNIQNYLNGLGGQRPTIIAYSNGGKYIDEQVAACNGYGPGCNIILVDPNNINNYSALKNFSNGSVNLYCTPGYINAANSGATATACNNEALNPIKHICSVNNHETALSSNNCGLENAISQSASAATPPSSPGTEDADLVGVSAASAAQTFKVDPICDKFFGLGAGTQKFPWDEQYLSPEYCEAVKDLVLRYNPGTCSSYNVPNPKVTGIIKLQPAFALALDKFLREQGDKNIGINSAYRDKSAPCSGSDSSHAYGCAVDLNIGNGGKTCDATCQKIKTGAAGLQVRADANTCIIQGSTPERTKSNECNHVEPVNLRACRSGAPGGGVMPGATAADQAARQKALQQAMEKAASQEKSGTSIGPGCVKNWLGVVDCSGHTYGNGLFGGNSDLMKMMMGMQLGQGLGQALGGLFNGSGSNQNTQPTQPTALPPIPLPVNALNLNPTTPIGTGSSTIEALIAALNNPSAASSTSMNAPSPVLVGSSTVGQLQTPSQPSGTTNASSSATTVPSITLAGDSFATSSAAGASSTQGSTDVASTLQGIINGLYAVMINLSNLIRQTFGTTQ